MVCYKLQVAWEGSVSIPVAYSDFEFPVSGLNFSFELYLVPAACYAFHLYLLRISSFGLRIWNLFVPCDLLFDALYFHLSYPFNRISFCP